MYPNDRDTADFRASVKAVPEWVVERNRKLLTACEADATLATRKTRWIVVSDHWKRRYPPRLKSGQVVMFRPRQRVHERPEPGDAA